MSWGWTPIYGLREQAAQSIGSYKVGQAVTVHYDPAQPDVAVLDPRKSKGSIAPLVIGLVFTAAAAGMLALFIGIGLGS